MHASLTSTRPTLGSSFAKRHSDCKENCPMKTLNMRRALSAALTGLALAAITQVSYAAGDVASQTQIAGLTEARYPPLRRQSQSRVSSGPGSPLTLYMEDTNGNAFRLIHVQGTGWKYAEGWEVPDSAAASLSRKATFRSTPSARPAKQAVPADEPLTVFIDGPSGFHVCLGSRGRVEVRRHDR